MDHFSPADWADFSRKLAPAEKRSDMEQHLQNGCKECGRSSWLWRRVAEIGARAADFEPPADVVSAVKNAYHVEKPLNRLLEWASLARVVFDSFVQPSPIAVRAALQASRQLIHESDPFTIDLRLEPDSSRRRILLTGQIMNAGNPNETADGVDVVLLRGAEQVAKTEASPSGEFFLDFTPADELRLFLNIRGLKGIAVPLPDMDG
jgi:hypothetical protein